MIKGLLSQVKGTDVVSTVEYEQSGVVFYRHVHATSIEAAKQQIQSVQPDVKIRAVSIVENQEQPET